MQPPRCEKIESNKTAKSYGLNCANDSQVNWNLLNNKFSFNNIKGDPRLLEKLTLLANIWASLVVLIMISINQQYE